MLVVEHCYCLESCSNNPGEHSTGLRNMENRVSSHSFSNSTCGTHRGEHGCNSNLRNREALFKFKAKNLLLLDCMIFPQNFFFFTPERVKSILKDNSGFGVVPVQGQLHSCKSFPSLNRSKVEEKHHELLNIALSLEEELSSNDQFLSKGFCD